jgi:hypothetical protein
MHNKIQLIEAALESVAPLSSPYLDDINSFPSISLIRHGMNVASRRHIGASKTLDSLQYSVRGYICSSVESSLDDCEALARNIETAIQSIHGDSIYSSKIIELHTDEGLFAPYGICDVICKLEWINE